MLEIKDIINRHKGQPALVMGMSRCLDRHVPHLRDYKKRGFVLLACSHWFEVRNMMTDYWVESNNDDTVMAHWKTMNERGATVLYAESVEETTREFAAEHLKVPYLAFDERHGEFDKDEKGNYHKTLVRIRSCCNRITPGRLTIQEELKKYTGYHEMNTFVCSVMEHMLSFSILFGCNPIYMVGVTLDYKYGYAGNLPPHGKGGGFKVHRHIILDNFRILRKHAEAVGTKIINISHEPTFDTFELGSICK